MAQNSHKPVVALDVAAAERPVWPDEFASRFGNWEGRALGDYFGLEHLGVNLERITPGCESALRHWHSTADEFVYILSGDVVLITDTGETPLRTGMCVGFRAGVADGHHLVNRSSVDALVLAAGTRSAGDRVTYPDDDFQWLEQRPGQWVAARRNGNPIGGPEQ